MFWDGTRWVDDGAKRPTRRPVGPRRLRDWFATIPIVLLLPALFAPLLATNAARPVPVTDPAIHVRGSLVPGGSIRISGVGFAPAAGAAILFDASQVLGELKTNRKGTFVASVTIPTRAAPGRHAIAVAYAPVAADAGPVASINVMISGEDSNVDPTAAPTAEPTPTLAPTIAPTTAPTVAPTMAPTVGPPPTAAPTADPGPNPPPTPDPTPRPTAEPTPKPDPTPDPTPKPTPDPTPTPPPPPSGTRPFAAPVTTDTYRVPTSIDATGATDASSELNAFIKSLPNGSVVSFPGSGVYRLNKGILLAGKKHIVLDGNGATLKLKGSGNDEAASAFLLRGSNHVAIRQFEVIGNNPNTTTLFNGGTELQHVLSLSAWYGGGPSTYVEISNVTASHIYADGAYLEGSVNPVEPSRHVWIHDNNWSYIGRNAISSINVTDLLVEDNRFDKIAYHVWDIEPNLAAETVRRNVFRRNIVGSYSHMTQFQGMFLGIWTPQGSVVSDIEVSDNVVSGKASSGYDGTPRGLNVYITSGLSARTFSDIKIVRNETSRAVRGPAMYARNVDGITVRNNVQPLISGSLASFASCTGVTYP